jgi:hypothetical protein
MPLLKRVVLLLGILILGLAAHLVPRAGAAGPDTSPSAWPRGCACAASGVEILTDWPSLAGGTAPEEPAPAQEAMPFDCGVGEAWRHHVP